MRSSVIAGALAASMLASVTTANAANVGLPSRAFEQAHAGGLVHRVHDASEVVDELRAKGYHQIRVVDPSLPRIRINACKDGNRWHLHANYYGDIVHRELIGPCYRDRDGYGYRGGYGNY